MQPRQAALARERIDSFWDGIIVLLKKPNTTRKTVSKEGKSGPRMSKSGPKLSFETGKGWSPPVLKCFFAKG